MNCLFCKIIEGSIPSYTIYENEYVKCFLDINPTSNADTLVVPKKHFVDISDMDIKYITEVHKASKIVIDMINKSFKPSGIKLVQNNGSLQEIKHYHVHITPSYKENNNLTIEEVYNKLIK